jgi:hypothetical protein
MEPPDDPEEFAPDDPELLELEDPELLELEDPELLEVPELEDPELGVLLEAPAEVGAIASAPVPELPHAANMTATTSDVPTRPKSFIETI